MLLAALPRGARTAMIVSHSSNIRGITGRNASSGEMLVLKLLNGGRFEVLGSLGGELSKSGA